MRLITIIRTVGLAAIAIAAFVVAVALRPPQPDAPMSSASAVTKALAEADLNELTADSAPKQQVVNGWVARDLLAINARQNDSLLELAAREPDQRQAWLMLLAVLAICWWGALTWPASAFAATTDSAASVPDDAGTEAATLLPPPPPPPPSPPPSELFIDPRPTTANP
ncbi:MAG: hypothetical protein N2037_07540 [Acidimicrobiales bacterium]|nr:hypothetical protein [Acidimicrobiales bacterium]